MGRRRKKKSLILRHKFRFGAGVIVFALFLLGYQNRISVYEAFFNEVFPNYKSTTLSVQGLLKTNQGHETDVVFSVTNTETENSQTSKSLDIIGLEDVEFQPETDINSVEIHGSKEILTTADLEKLKDLEYLKEKFYTIDSRTDIKAADIDAEKFLQMDFSISQGSGSEPKILIFHTHSLEGYKDSVDMPNDGIFLVGDHLAKLLEEQYGIPVLHYKGQFDTNDGKSQVLNGAYDRMAVDIQKILVENPSIEVVLDLHRDGVPESRHLVQNINGKPTAQIMFVNGLSQIYKDNVLTDISYLPNPYKTENLAFSFQAQLHANAKYPDFTRKSYLNAYRYSTYMAARSMLVEVGAQTNTKEEALNAMELFAEVLAEILLGKA